MRRHWHVVLETTHYPLRFTQSAGSLTASACILRLGTKLFTSTYKTGINSRFKLVAAIIPPNTVVPTETRPATPAPCATTNGTTPKINASDVIRIGRNRIR